MDNSHTALDVPQEKSSPADAPQQLMIRDLPRYERPYTRLEQLGPSSLSVLELLSILIGGEHGLIVAAQLIQETDDLTALARLSAAELQRLSHIGPATAAKLRAAFELGQRLVADTRHERLRITTPEDAAQLVMAEMSLLEQEELRVLLLDTRNRLVRMQTIYRGSLNAVSVRVAEVFQWAVRLRCAALILVHNHPSSDPTPSPDDVRMTQTVVEAGQLLDVEVLDHLIIGGNTFVSMKEKSLGF